MSMDSILENYELPGRDQIVASFRWAADAFENGTIPDTDLYVILAGNFCQVTQANATRLIAANSQPETKLLPINALAKEIGTTPQNLKQHLTTIKNFLRDKGLRSHTNDLRRKIPKTEPGPGRFAFGFTEEEIQAVAQRVRDRGGLPRAFPIKKRSLAAPLPRR
ncbi:hypothetical protein ACQUQQ_08740 [Acidithiobacillus ferrooxidans]|uniref:hypothetical protein n=1 Tax=Acidithiobacillus ferrooxidans TaxID=920 RepID=UPI003D16DB93